MRASTGKAVMLMAAPMNSANPLNETLASVPDIDLDFPREIREELIRRVYRRYGAEHVGLVCSFPTYRLRSAVREIGKALDLPPGEIEQVTKLADRRSGSLADELEQLPGFEGRKNARYGRSCASSPKRSPACRGTCRSMSGAW